jgi:outer membrane protein assembly factor BamB
MRQQKKLACILSAFVSLALLAAEETPITGWRGDGSGAFPHATPPTEWGADKNVLWKTPLDKPSNASPIISGDKIFICADPDELICLSKTTGAVLWRKTNPFKDTLPVAEAAAIDDEVKQYKALEAEMRPLSNKYNELQKKIRDLSRPQKKDEKAKAEEQKKDPEEVKKALEALKKEAEELKPQLDAFYKKMEPLARSLPPKTHDVNGFSTPTPVSDGTYVYVLYCTGVAACWDLNGERQWIKFVERPKNGWGHSSSPVLTDGKLIVHILGLKALEAKTGKQLWATPSAQKWGSPVAVNFGGVAATLTPGGDLVRTADGKLLASKLSDLTYATPLLRGNIAYFIQKGGKALLLPDQIINDKAEVKTLWQTQPKDDRYYASTAFANDLLFAVNQKGEFSAIEPQDGSIVWCEALKLKPTFYPSVTVAGKYVFVSNDGGKTLVVEPGREFKQIAENTLEPFRSSPVFEGDKMYVRTAKNMYCIGPKAIAAKD